MNNQLRVALYILAGGLMVLGAEVLLVRWYPGHHQREVEATLRMQPYSNDAFGIQMQVANGIAGKFEVMPGSLRISHPIFWGQGPSITITSQPNPAGSNEFSPQTIAEAETEGVRKGLLGFQFDHTSVNGRDTMITEQYDSVRRWMVVTANIIAPDRIIQAVCTTGGEDQTVYLQACENSLRTIQLPGSPPPPPPPQQTSGNVEQVQ